jgi:hypothetical protein
MKDYLQKQERKPLYEDILWSRPENKAHAGRLLIIGGNSHAFAAPAQAYGEALKAGAGECKVLMPASVKKLIPMTIPDCEYVASTPSGSFSQKSLNDWLAFAAWSDLVLLAGDIGRNSETAIVLESFTERSPLPIVLTRDALDYFIKTPKQILMRPGTTFVLCLAQLQKVAISASFPKAVTFSIDFVPLVEWLHEFTTLYSVNLVLKHHTNLFVAVSGKVSVTKFTTDSEIWRLPMAVQASVFAMQNPSRTYDALTTAAFEYIRTLDI